MEMVSVLSDCVPNYITKSGTFILKKKFYRIRNIHIAPKHTWLVYNVTTAHFIEIFEAT